MKRSLLTGLACVAALAGGCATPMPWAKKSPDVAPARAERREEALKRFEEHRDEAQYAAAMERWTAGDPDTCEAQLRSLVARNPKHLPARRALADMLLDKGNPAQAEAELVAILEFAPDDAQTQHSLGLLLESQGRFDQAHVHLARAAEIAPDNTLYQLCLQNHAEAPVAPLVAARPQ